MPPLTGLNVLDFSTTVPGPLATLALADAGATVVKVERRDGGDPTRRTRPLSGGESLQFTMLNRGKRSLAVDLKDPDDRAAVVELAGKADILVEQFRPGVMDRLGLGYEALSRDNPGLIYCSITGYGQDGPYARRAGHDLNYLAKNGVLSLGGKDGEPVLPPALIADIGGGTYPALVNILLALLERERTGRGRHLDIAMAEQIFPWISRQLAVLAGDGAAPRPGESSHTGGTPRYGVYRAADGRYVAIAPLEEKFWHGFCKAIDLPAELRATAADAGEVRAAIAERLAKHTSSHWQTVFGDDSCVDVVRDLGEATADPHFTERGIFAQKLTMADGRTISALPPIPARGFVRDDAGAAPPLGELSVTDDPWSGPGWKST